MRHVLTETGGPMGAPPGDGGILRCAMHAVGLAVCLSVAMSGCGSGSGQTSYVTFVEATVDGAEPLAGVRLNVGGRPVGETDESGKLRLAIPGQEGDRIALAAQCPSGYRVRSAPRSIVLRQVRGLQGAGEPVPLEVRVSCAPMRRRAVLLVRTSGQGGIGVNLEERRVAETSAKGVAHVLLSARPGKRIEVKLDTSDRPKLRPQNPRRVFVVPDGPDLFALDQQFEVDEPDPPPRRRRRRRRRQRPSVPTPLGQNHHH